MKNLSLIASALAMLGLTACEKGLDEGIADVAPAGLVVELRGDVETLRLGQLVAGAKLAFLVLIFNQSKF